MGTEVSAVILGPNVPGGTGSDTIAPELRSGAKAVIDMCPSVISIGLVYIGMFCAEAWLKKKIMKVVSANAVRRCIPQLIFAEKNPMDEDPPIMDLSSIIHLRKAVIEQRIPHNILSQSYFRILRYRT